MFSRRSIKFRFHQWVLQSVCTVHDCWFSLKGPCNHLITQCLILLLAIHSIPTPHIDRKDEILSFALFSSCFPYISHSNPNHRLFQQINHDITEWGELTTVKALIRKTDINSKIDMFQGNVNRFIAMFTRPGKKVRMVSFHSKRWIKIHT